MRCAVGCAIAETVGADPDQIVAHRTRRPSSRGNSPELPWGLMNTSDALAWSSGPGGNPQRGISRPDRPAGSWRARAQPRCRKSSAVVGLPLDEWLKSAPSAVRSRRQCETGRPGSHQEHGDRTQRMRALPERELREALVKSGVGPSREDGAHSRAWQAERQHAQRHIHPVGAPERLDHIRHRRRETT